MWDRFLALIVLGIGSLGLIAPAVQAACLTGLRSNGSALVSIDLQTGASSNWRGLGLPNFRAMAQDPNGVLYGIRAGSPARLYTIDTTTGTVTPTGTTGSTGLDITEAGLDFDPFSGVLYGVNGDGGSGTGIFRVNNLSTGASTMVGTITDPTGSPKISGLAFDNAGALFGLKVGNGNGSFSPFELLALDTSGNISNPPSVGLTGLPMFGTTFAGMEFDDDTGTLYILYGAALRSVNPITGASVDIRTGSTGAVIGGSFANSSIEFLDCPSILLSDVFPDISHVPGGGAGPAYDFGFGRFEVTNSQFVAFLNDAQLDGGGSLRGSNMVFFGTGRVETPGGSWMFRPKGDGGITHSSRIIYTPGAALGSRYSVESPYEDHPVTTVSWFGAVKYSNWLTAAWGMDPSEAVYTEGTNPEDWHPVVISTSDWISRPLNDNERQDLVDNYTGFRLPMDNLRGTGWMGHQENPYNEWYKAAAYDPLAPATVRTVIPVPAQPWNNYTISPYHWVYGFGSDAIAGEDANFNTSGDPFEIPTLQDDTPVGFYNGTHYNPGGSGTVGTGVDFQSRGNRNPWDIYDLAGNLMELIGENDPLGVCSLQPVISCIDDNDCPGADVCFYSGAGSIALRGGNFANSASTYNEEVNSYRVEIGPDNVGGGFGFRIMTTHALRLYCISGMSSGQAFSWALGGSVTHTELNAPATTVPGDEEDLVDTFVASINAALLSGVSAAKSPLRTSCFHIEAPGPSNLLVGAATQTPVCMVSTGGCDYNPFIWQEAGGRALLPLPEPVAMPGVSASGTALLAALLAGLGRWVGRLRRQA